MMKTLGIFLLGVFVFSGCNLVMSMSFVEDVEAVARLRIEPASKNFLVAKSFRLKAFYTNSEGEELDITAKASWWISDPDLAQLSGTGVLQTNNPGSALISVSYNGLSLESEYNFVTPSQLWLTFYGGTGSVTTKSMIATKDGGYLILGEACSNVEFQSNEELRRGFKGAADFFMLKIAANGDYQWHSFLGGSQMDIPSAVIESQDGGFYVLGSSNSKEESDFGLLGGIDDLLLAKLNSQGNLLWARFIGSIGEDTGLSLAQLENGDIIVAGTTDYLWTQEIYTDYSDTDVIIAQIDDQSGKILWTDFFGSSKDDKPVKILVDDQGYIYCLAEIAGALDGARNSYAGQKDYYIRCLNSQKELEWESYFGTQVDDIPRDMIVTDEAVVITGSSSKNIDTALNSYSKRAMDILTVALSKKNGEVLWSSFHGGASDDVPASIIEVEDCEGFMIVGSSSAEFGKPLNNYSGMKADVLLVRLDNQGLHQWHTFYGGLGDQIPIGIVNASNEGFVVSGCSSHAFGEPKNAFTGDGNNLFAVHFLKNGVCPQIIED